MSSSLGAPGYLPLCFYSKEESVHMHFNYEYIQCYVTDKAQETRKDPPEEKSGDVGVQIDKSETSDEKNFKEIEQAHQLEYDVPEPESVIIDFNFDIKKPKF